MNTSIRTGLERDNEGRKNVFKRIAHKIKKKPGTPKEVPKQPESNEVYVEEVYTNESVNAHHKLPESTHREREVLSKAIVMHPSIAHPTNANIIAVKMVLLLYNPESGSHQGGKIARDAKRMLLESNIEVHMIALERRGHGEELCKTLDLKPFDVICFIGGDGTFHECVNGLMQRDDDEGHNIPVAMLAGGTGNSFAMELLGDTDLSLAIDTVKRGVNVPIDVAKVCKLEPNEQGELTNTIYSFNSIHWGLASKVNVTAERLRWMGKAVRYTTAALLELLHGDSSPARITYEDAFGKVVEYNEEFCLAIANNIVVAAKGMKMAPKAKLNDGLIDLLLIRSHKAFDLMAIFKHVYDGTHTDLSFVEYVQVKWFSIVPYRKENGGIMLEADPSVAEEVVDIDGELKGATPFRCDVIRNAIKVII